MAHGKIYTFGPTFRAEKSKTRRHLTEFWMIEPEMAFYDLAMNMEVAEELLVAIVTAVAADCGPELAVLERDVESSSRPGATAPFPRLSYTEAVDLLTSDATQLMLDAEAEGLEDERHALTEEHDRNRQAYGQAKKGEKRRIDAREIEINVRLDAIEEGVAQRPAVEGVPPPRSSGAPTSAGARRDDPDQALRDPDHRSTATRRPSRRST